MAQDKGIFVIIAIVLVVMLPVVVVAAKPRAPITQANVEPAGPTFDEPVPTEVAHVSTVRPSEVTGSFVYDLNMLTTDYNIHETDNVRWSLVRRSPQGAALWTKANGVNYTKLRQVTTNGTITIPPGTWSFNSVFRAGVGYKRASGYLAGGHCALASMFKMAAENAGLRTGIDKKHKDENGNPLPIPGFTADQSVSIYWGRDDLRVYNDTGEALQFVWYLTPDTLAIDVTTAPPIPKGDRYEMVRLSWYWPPAGGPNCSRFVDGVCTSRTASGERWEDWVDTGCACPKEWPFGTVVRLPDHGVECTCVDRGGRIVYEVGIAWVDLLREHPLIAYGANTQGVLKFP